MRSIVRAVQVLPVNRRAWPTCKRLHHQQRLQQARQESQMLGASQEPQLHRDAPPRPCPSHGGCWNCAAIPTTNSVCPRRSLTCVPHAWHACATHVPPTSAPACVHMRATCVSHTCHMRVACVRHACHCSQISTCVSIKQLFCLCLGCGCIV